jgi:DNA-directed RNA polymerase subunit F
LSIIKKKTIAVVEARKLLEEAGEDLSPLQRRVLDYTIRFSKLDFENSTKLLEELTKEVGLDQDTAIQIVNCLPRSLEEIRTILGRQRIISEENLKKILEIITRHVEAGN